MKLLVGDCLERLKELPDNSVDSVVTDPPYGLEFMGKEWDAPWKDSAAYVGRGGVGTTDQGDKSGWSRYTLDRPQAYVAGAAFQQWCELWAAECLRVLKPGGHMLAFGGTRTYHRMACAIEDAGFEIRDSIHWTYGSGFPKSLNAFKNIKEQLCPSHESAPHAALVSPWHPVASPEAKAPIAVALARTLQGDVPVLLTRTGEAGDSPAMTATSWSELTATTSSNTDTSWRNIWDALCDPTSTSTTSTTTAATTAWQTCNSLTSQNTPDSTTPGRADPNDGCKCSAATVATPSSAASLKCSAIRIPTAPASAIGLGADYLAGTGTAAKPSHEPIVVARKPFTGTVAANVLEHGTGALNIDGCRVGEADGFGGGAKASGGFVDGYTGGDGFVASAKGRWPANTVLTHAADCDPDGAPAVGCPCAEMDKQSGVSRDGVAVRRNGSTSEPRPSSWDKPRIPQPDMGYGGEGGASRFFQQTQWSDEWDGPVFIYQAKASKKERNAGLDKNHHPTVKPVALMRYLVRLVTPPGGKVLDPFMGSGTTAVAATLEGFDWVGVELTDEYVDLIKGRVVHAYQEYRKSQEQQSFEIGDPA